MAVIRKINWGQVEPQNHARLGLTRLNYSKGCSGSCAYFVYLHPDTGCVVSEVDSKVGIYRVYENQARPSRHSSSRDCAFPAGAYFLVTEVSASDRLCARRVPEGLSFVV